MKGIIYKFSLKTNGKYYVGQTLSRKFENYWGSGSVWNDYLKNLKKRYPTCWKKLVKREILWQGECNQKLLDKMEEVYIRREKALHILGLGGCNILSGTSNGFGSGSPMKNPEVVKKVSESLRKTYAEHLEIKERIHAKRRWSLHHTDYREKISRTLMGKYSGDNNPNFGNKWTDEQKKKLSEKMKGRYNGDNNPNFGNKWTDEQREIMSQKMRKRARQGDYVNPMTGKVRITNGVINTVIFKNEPLPEGFWYGMKSRK